MRGSAGSGRSGGWSILPRLGWALAACFIMVTGVLVFTNNRLRSELKRSQTQVIGLTRELEIERSWAAVVAAPGARAASFSLTPDGAAELRARATYDPGTRRAVLVFENFRAMVGRDYQLWALRGNTPASLGLIRGDESGRAVLRVEEVGDPATLTAFAISLELTGGSPTPNAPTGPVVMLAGIGG